METKKLIDLCKDKTVWIQTHNFPDPDALTSAFGLQKYLEAHGVFAKICYAGQIDKLSTKKLTSLCKIEAYAYEEIKDKLQETDMIILVDSQKGNKNIDDFVGEELAVIDHHPVVHEIEYEYADLRLCGACATLIAEYYKDSGIVPDKYVATALLYGIKMDTLQLSRGVTALDLDMISFLFNYADKKLLRKLETNNLEFKDLKAYGEAISNIKAYGSIGFSYVDFSCPDALVAMLSDFILSLNEIDVVVLYSTRSKGYKFSARSERSDVDAGAMLSAVLSKWGNGCNGGGHSTMAGGFVPKEVFKDYQTDDRNSIIEKDFLNYIDVLWNS